MGQSQDERWAWQQEPAESARDRNMDRENSMRMHTSAREYTEACEILAGNPDAPSGPTWHCGFQALELVLKAYLRGHGWCLDHLSGRALSRRGNNVGHDIELAYRLAKDVGMADLLALTDRQEQILGQASRLWKCRWAAYVPVGTVLLPPIEEIVGICRVILDATRDHCFKAMHLHDRHDGPADAAPKGQPVVGGCGCDVPDLGRRRKGKRSS